MKDSGTSRFGLIKDTGAAHWYDRDAQPRHKTNIKGAIRDGLYPSVTSVLKLYPKPALERWKLEQAIMASLTLPRKPDESADEFAKRVAVDMNEEAIQAAKVGSDLHALMSVRLMTGSWPEWAGEKNLLPWCEAYEPWIRTEIKHTFISEGVLVNHKLGYAGTVDLVADTRQWGVAVLDFKNQNVRQQPAFYDEWLYQLEAYARALRSMKFENFGLTIEDLPPTLVSVVLNRNQPDPPAIQVWPEGKGRERAWTVFKTCMALWVLVKDYDPLDWQPPLARRSTSQQVPLL